MRWNLIFLGLTVLGIVLTFAQNIAKNLGINMPQWLAILLSYFGIAVAFVMLSLVFLGFFPGIVKNHIWFVALFTLVGAVCGGFGAWVYLRHREVTKQTVEPLADKTDDITWSFDADAEFYFLAMVGGKGQEPWVDSFQAHGKNNMDEPVARTAVSYAQMLPMRSFRYGLSSGDSVCLLKIRSVSHEKRSSTSLANRFHRVIHADGILV